MRGLQRSLCDVVRFSTKIKSSCGPSLEYALNKRFRTPSDPPIFQAFCFIDTPPPLPSPPEQEVRTSKDVCCREVAIVEACLTDTCCMSLKSKQKGSAEQDESVVACPLRLCTAKAPVMQPAIVGKSLLVEFAWLSCIFCWIVLDRKVFWED